MTALITIFSTLKPFTQPHVSLIQTNALNSWNHLGGEVEVLLIGEEEGVAQAAKKARVRLIPEVKRNHLGTPLVSSIFELARDNSESPLLAYVNADILLTTDFVTISRRVMHQSQEFLMVGRRWDLDIDDLLDFSQDWESRLRMMVKNQARLHPAGGSDYFMFPRTCFRQIPDMVIGRAGWDNWMIYKARAQGWRVINASPVFNVIHQQHDYAHLPGGKPHYRLPESEENVTLAGGHHAIYTLADANWQLTQGGLVKIPLTWKRFVREIEIFPATCLRWTWGAMVSYAIFHPVRTYWQVRKYLSELRHKGRSV
jgi:hypothetical protein